MRRAAQKPPFLLETRPPGDPRNQHDRRSQLLTGNVGLYFCCYKLSLLGWNVMRSARGVDIIAYSGDASRFVGVQVKSLSKRNPVPLGSTLDRSWAISGSSLGCFRLQGDCGEARGATGPRPLRAERTSARARYSRCFNPPGAPKCHTSESPSLCGGTSPRAAVVSCAAAAAAESSSCKAFT